MPAAGIAGTGNHQLRHRSQPLPHLPEHHAHKFKEFAVPYIIDAHGVPYYNRKSFIKKVFDRIWGRTMLREAELLIAETEVGVQEYLALDPDLDREKIVIISPPFDTDEFEVLPQRGAFRRAHSIPDDVKVLMFLGRVHHIKGNDFLIKGFAGLAKRRDDVIYIVGGDDGHMDEYKRAKELRS